MANKKPLVVSTGLIQELASSDTIPVSVLETLSTLKVVITDAGGKLSVSTVTNTELGYLSGVTSSIQTQFSNKQPLDADLTAIAALTTTGIAVRTAADTWNLRTILGTSGNIVLTNGDGVGGNPTINLATAGIAGNNYVSVNTDAFGRVIAGSTTQAWSTITGTPTSLAGYGITNAYTKTEVDTIITGMDNKTSVRLATTANITLSGSQVIDSVTPVNGDRILVKNQTTASQNGIYAYTSSGAWTRVSDADQDFEVTSGMYVYVEEGGQIGSGWNLTTANPIVVGTTALNFTQFNGLGQIIAGAGLTKSGNTLDIGTASSSRIVISIDNIDLATTGIGAGTYKSVTVDVYGRITAGTNPTTLAGYGIVDAQPLDADLTSIAGLAGTSGFLKKTAADTWALDTTVALTTGNLSQFAATTSAQLLGIMSDETGSGLLVFNNAPTLINPVFSGFTQGSVLFAGVSGALSQSNGNFFWDNTQKTLAINSAGGGSLTLKEINASTTLFNTNANLRLGNNNSTVNNWTGIQFDAANGNITAGISAQIVDQTNSYSTLQFHTRTSTGWAERLRIHSNNFVGINQSTPAEQLDVVGNIRFGGGTGGYLTDNLGYAYYGVKQSSAYAAISRGIKPYTGGGYIKSINATMNVDVLEVGDGLRFYGNASDATALNAAVVPTLRLTLGYTDAVSALNWLPSSDLSKDLGTPSLRWNNVNAGTGNFTTINVSSGSAGGLELSRTIPIVVNDYVEIGNVSMGSGAHNLRISITNSNVGFAVAKTYLIAVDYNTTNNTWQTVLPIVDGGAYSGNDYDLDINVFNQTAYFRLRRSLGTTAGTAKIRIELVGESTDAFTATSATGSTTAPTIFVNGFYQSAAGNVGIGNKAPTTKLQVDGTISIGTPTGGIQQLAGNTGSFSWRGTNNLLGNNTAQAIIKAFREGGTTATDLIQVYTDNATTPAFFVKGGGFTGVGTSNPQVRFQVGETTDTIANGIRVTTSATADANPHFSLVRSGSIQGVLGIVDNGSLVYAINPASINNTGLTNAAKLTISSAGLVGLGVSPTANTLFNFAQTTNTTSIGISGYALTTGNSSTSVIGAVLNGYHSGTGAQTGGVMGIQATGISQGASATVANLWGGYFGVQAYNSSVVANASAVIIPSPVVASGGTFGSATGVNINPQKVAGVTTGYGLYASGASDINYLAGYTGFGTNTPKTLIEIASSYSTLQNNVRTYSNVYSFASGNATETGTLKITLPVGARWNNSMLRIEIEGYNYSGGSGGSGGAWKAIISGYNFSATPAWVNCSLDIIGEPPFTSARFADDTTQNVLLLGTTTTTWNYPRFTITSVIDANNSNLGVFGSGWGSSFIVSETGIVNISTMTTRKVAYTIGTSGLAYTQGGNTFGATATLGTNDNNTLQFRTNNVVRTTLDTAGNFGIGITPTVKLHTYDAGNGTTALFTSGLTASMVGFKSNVGGTRFIGADDSTDFHIFANDGSTKRVTVTNAGKVGIGIANSIPKLLSLFDATAPTIRQATTNYSYDVGMVADDGVYKISRNDGVVIDRVKIDVTGNVLFKSGGDDVEFKLGAEMSASTAINNYFGIKQKASHGGEVYLKVGRSNGGTGTQYAWNSAPLDDPTVYPNQNTHTSFNTNSTTPNGVAVVYIGNGSISTNTRQSLYTENGAIFAATRGSVGIGLLTPNAKLEITETTTDATILQEVLRVSTTGRTTASGVNGRGTLIGFYDANNPTLTAAIGGLREAPSGNYLGGLAFYVNPTNALPTNAVASLSEALYIASGGQVGIGGRSNGAKLHVVGDAGINTVGSTIARNRLQVGSQNWYLDNRGTQSTPNNRFSISEDGGERFTILTGGNVGIGNTSNTEKLEVTGNIKLTNSTYALKGQYINLVKETNFGYAPASYHATQIGGGTSISLGVDVSAIVGSAFTGSNELIIPNIYRVGQVNSGGTDFINPVMGFNNGNVGIGVVAATSKLTVIGAASAPSGNFGTAALMNVTNGLTDLVTTINNAAPFAASIQHRHISLNGNFYPIALNPLGGNVGIGVANPLGGLEVAQDVRINGVGSGGANLQLTSIGASANIQFYRVGYNNWFLGSPNNSTGFGVAENSASTYRMYFQGGGNIGINTTSPITTLDVNGTISRGFSTGQTSRTYTNLYSFASANSSDTGTFKLVIPTAARWSNTMVRMTITGYNYSGGSGGTGGAWEVIVSGYNYSVTPAWTNCSVEISGSAPFSSVRLGDDGANNVILLGTTANTWLYPMISIVSLEARHSLNDNWGGTWSGSFITVETGITNIVTPVVRSVAYTSGGSGLAFVNGGNSFGTIATLGTNDSQVLAFETNSIERMRIGAANGNVSIGTTTNSYKLYVNGGSVDTLLAESAGAVITAHFKNTSANNTIIRTTNNSGNWFDIQNNTDNSFTIDYNDSEKLRLTSAGQLGIGTANPTAYNVYAKLAVSGSSGGGAVVAEVIDESGSQSALYLRNRTSGTQNGYGAVALVGANLGLFSGTTGSLTQAIQILGSNQNVGIGETSPNAKLVVGAASAGAQTTVKIYGDSGANKAPVLSIFRTGSRESVIAQTTSGLVLANTSGLANYNDATIDAASSLMIDSLSRVGLGTTSPVEKLDLGTVGGIKLPTNSSALSTQTLYYSNTDLLKFGVTKTIEKATVNTTVVSQDVTINSGDYWDLLSISSFEFGSLRLQVESSGNSHGSFREYEIPISYANDVWAAYGISSTNNVWLYLAPSTEYSRAWGDNFVANFRIAVNVNNGAINFRLVCINTGTIRGDAFTYGNAVINSKFYLSDNASALSSPAVLATTGTGMTLPTTYLPTSISGTTGYTVLRRSLIVGNGYKAVLIPPSNGLIVQGNSGFGTNNPTYPLDVVGVVNTDTGYRISGGAPSGQYLRGNGANFVSATISAADIASALSTSSIGNADTLNWEDNRTISPSELAVNKLKFGFTSFNNNNTSPFADFLHFRSYTDSSGGDDNLLVFKKTGFGARLYQQTFGSTTAYSTYKDIALVNNGNTVNYIPKFTNTTNGTYIGNSSISDSGTLVSVNSNLQAVGALRSITLGNGQGIKDVGGPELSIFTIVSADIVFLPNNTEKARLLSNGNFGIGTPSASQKLSVTGNALIGTESSTRVLITGGGGTSALAEYYQAESNSRWSIGRDTYGTGAGIAFNASGSTYQIIGGDSSGNLLFATASSLGSGSSNERMRLNSTGLGIGTLVSPVSRLEVSASNTANYWSSNTFGGSTTPSHALTLTNSAATGYDVPIIFRMATSTGVLTTTAAINIANAGAWTNTSVASQVSDMLFIVRDSSGVLQERFKLSYSGVSTLTGSLNVTSTLSIGGASVPTTSAGTTNKIVKYSGTTGLTSSIITDTGTNVGINQGIPTSTFHLTGSEARTITTTATNYTVLATDSIILVDSTSGARTITLPDATACVGRLYKIKDWKGKSATNNITIVFNSTQLCDGASSIILLMNYDFVELISDGQNWSIIG